MAPQTYPQARYWILTIPHAHFVPYLPPDAAFIKGQLERGEQTGYLHWQLVVAFKTKKRLKFVRQIFGDFNIEPTRSALADDYVWKEDTRINGTQFVLGTKPINRSAAPDWDGIRQSAMQGQLSDIPSDIFVRCYHQLTSIWRDNLVPLAIERECYVFWGPTGTGKSRTAWQQAGLGAYPKVCIHEYIPGLLIILQIPTTKFWDGYKGQLNVVIDEFRGIVDISAILRWCDRYPVLVEIKGSSRVLSAEKLWFTSNIHPKDWYPLLDEPTKLALLRRLTIVHFPSSPIQELLTAVEDFI